MFDKSVELFPIKQEIAYLANCGVSPMFSGAAAEMAAFCNARMLKGIAPIMDYPDILDSLRESLATITGAAPLNFAFMKNTAEAMSIIANGYPLNEGDEIISYVHEYPSNHYPWLIQQQRGAKLVLLDDIDPIGNLAPGKPRGWSLDDLERATTDRTRIVAISHVQFTSGFAADLAAVGEFCHSRGIDLIVDVAQSLGALPVRPEEFHISALAGSGWKWLLGPVGAGVMYTSPEFRAKIKITMTGPNSMTQGLNYLDHTWSLLDDARRFEYSSVQLSYAAALDKSLKLFCKYDPADVRDEIFRLQDLFIDRVDTDRYRPLIFAPANRSGILSMETDADIDTILTTLAEQGISLSSRGGYLRIAPHFYNDDAEIIRTAEALNAL
ncbi:MAG: aminotransferase class V-fold PLP-dependent enzyme [Phycisphaerales bacterium]|jgi:cysteine desulfurase / selenocysteine lyase|nr:aminotransferase class V-fold PLP-dependent enzyme [Phycisphaerales bacterium]